MKYRIAVFGLPGWTFIVSHSAEVKLCMTNCSNKGTFETKNINNAYKYREYMETAHTTHKYKYEVKEV